MKYTEKKVKRIKELLPMGAMKKIHEKINDGIKEGSPDFIPLSTVRDTLGNYRTQTGEFYIERKTRVYDEAVRLLKSKGIKV
jgi:hypothetical protein